jgi:copper transport protein
MAHVLAVAFWIGALWPLYELLRRRPSGEALSILRRFSNIAVAAVALLVIVGIYLALTLIEDIGSLINTRYGQVLLTKIAAITALIAIAVYNRGWLTQKFLKGGKARLVRNIKIEIVLSGIVLLLTAALTHLSPESSAQGQHVTAHASKNGYHLVLHLSPARSGSNTALVNLHKPDGTPLDSKEVTIELALPSTGIEGLRRDLTPRQNGIYSIDRIDLPAAGRWRVSVEVLVSDFEKIRLETDISIR